MSLSFVVDHEQRRRKLDRLPVYASGFDFKDYKDETIWQEPETGVCILKPGYEHEDWLTSNSGIFAKQPLASFTVATPSKWVEVSDDVIKGPWLSILDTAYNEMAVTTGVLAENRGFYIALVATTAGETFEHMQCGWGDTGDYNDGLAFRYYSNGIVQVYHEGILKVAGNIGTSSSSQSGAIVEIVFLPFREHELLIYSPSTQKGFIYVNEIDEDFITPEDNVWINVLTGTTKFMFADIKFASAGNVFSKNVSFQEAPSVTDVYEEFYNNFSSDTREYLLYGNRLDSDDDIEIELYDLTDSPFTFNSTNYIGYVKASLTSNTGHYTPYFYGAQIAVAAVFGTTDGSEETDITDQIQTLTLELHTDPTQNSLSGTFKGLSNIPYFFTQQHRPARLTYNDKVWFDGFFYPQQYHLSPNPDADLTEFEVWSYWRDLEEYMNVEPVILDGRDVLSVLTDTIKLSAIDEANIDIEDPELNFDYVPSKGDSLFSFVKDVGTTSASIIKDTMEEYLGFWYYGLFFDDDGQGFFAYPASSNTTSLVTLYGTLEEAVSIGGYTEDEARNFVYSSFEETPMPYEANEVRVTGYNAVTEKIIHAFKIDTNSQDITIAPSSRNENWVGYSKKYGLVDAKVNKDDVAQRVCSTLFDRLSQQYHMAEITCELLLDDAGYIYQPGTVISLYNNGFDYRIASVRAEFVKVFDTLKRIKTTYTLTRGITI